MQNELYNAPYVPKKINDKDGDGVEDNQKKTQSELEKFRNPVFGADIDDIHNTNHGHYPGQERATDHPEPKLLAAANATLPAEIAKSAAKKPTDVTKLMSETDEIAQSVKDNMEDSESFNDKQYLQIGEFSSQDLLSKFIDVVNSPEDLSNDNLLMFEAGNNKIYDADGDGVEDNVYKTHDELDKYYIPNRFFPTEDVYNTRHGNLPGHLQKEYYDSQHEPASMDLVKHTWKKW
jgi:hypothetical protein